MLFLKKFILYSFLIFCFLTPPLKSNSEESQNIVKSSNDLKQASYQLECKTKVKQTNLGGGSGSIIYHEVGGPLVILTAAHVTLSCDTLEADLYLKIGKNIYKTKQIAYSGQHDLAILETKENFKKQIKYFKISKTPVYAGQSVWTAGFPAPFRYADTLIISKGIVNASEAPYPACIIPEWDWSRVLWDCVEFDYFSTTVNFILTDSAIGPGNSGGSLLNSKLELIGVTVAATSMGNWRPLSVPTYYIWELIEKTPYAGKL